MTGPKDESKHRISRFESERRKNSSQLMSSLTKRLAQEEEEEAIYAKISDYPRDIKQLKRASVVGVHKRVRPKRSFLFVVMLTWADGSDVTIYRKYKEIRLLQNEIAEVLKTNPKAEEAQYYLSKYKYKTFLRGMTPSKGTMKYLHLVDVLNLYFKIFTHYFNFVQDLEVTKSFFTLSAVDLNAFKWSKSGKTFLYVTKSMMTQRKVSLVNHEAKNEERDRKDDAFATLSRKPSSALPLVSRRRQSFKHKEMPSTTENNIYVAIEAHSPREVDRHHKIVDLQIGERVEVLVRSKTGWWFVKRLDNKGNPYGYVPASYLAKECKSLHVPMTESSITQTSAPKSTEHKRPMITRANTVDVITTKLLEASNPNQNKRHDYVTTKAYAAQSSDELSFGEGAILQVIERKEDGWWFARYKNTEGYVPGILLKMYNDPIRKLSLEVFQ